MLKVIVKSAPCKHYVIGWGTSQGVAGIARQRPDLGLVFKYRTHSCCRLGLSRLDSSRLVWLALRFVAQLELEAVAVAVAGAETGLGLRLGLVLGLGKYVEMAKRNRN